MADVDSWLQRIDAVEVRLADELGDRATTGQAGRRSTVGQATRLPHMVDSTAHRKHYGTSVSIPCGVAKGAYRGGCSAGLPDAPHLLLHTPVHPPGVVLSVNTPTTSAQFDAASVTGRSRPAETKPAVKTTEFVVYVLAVVGVLLASALVGDSDGRGDVFLADQAWLYVTLLTIGYMISRGLAKAGSRAHHDA